MQQSLIETLAMELWKAEGSGITVSPITSRYSHLSVEDSYLIQLEIMKQKIKEGRTVIGKKVGLTSKAMQRMLGVNEPDYGHLFDDMKVESGAHVDIRTMIQPKIEAEIGFILEEDLKGPYVTFVDVMLAAKWLVPALEIIDSRIENWDIQLVDTVADNGSSAKVVVGKPVEITKKINPRTISMTLYQNESIVSTGAGAAALGHPAHAIAWLANKLHAYDISLKAGEIILPGALTSAVNIAVGDSFQADFGSLGSVSVHF